MAIQSLIPMILSMLSSQGANGRTGMQNISYFGEGGGPGSMLGGQGYAGKDTYGSTGKSVAANIFDPGGFIRPGGKKEKEPTLEEMLDRMKNWQRSQPEYIAYKGEIDEMGDSPTYGAVGPDWEDIKARATEKVNQYYWGSPIGGGVMDKIRASIARRNVADSPAEGVLQSRLGAEEGGQLREMEGNFGQAEQAFTEAARTDYMNRLAGLADMGTSTSSMTSLLPFLMPEEPNTQGQAQSGELLGGILGSLFGGKGGNLFGEKTGAGYGADMTMNTSQFGQVGGIKAGGGTTAWNAPTGQRFIY